MGMSQSTLHNRKPLTGYAAAIALQLNAKVTSTVQRDRNQGAAGAGEGIKENLSSLKFFGSRRLPTNEKLPLTRATELHFKDDFFSMKAVSVGESCRRQGPTASTHLHREGNGPHNIQLCGPHTPTVSMFDQSR